MSRLNPTPRDRLCDAQGRPYFLWDMDMTLERFEELLHHGDLTAQAWLTGKLMRQAKPDDVFEFVTLRRIRELWPELQRHLGRSKPFWTWLLEEWEREDAA
jgi:hypothetical protein